MDKLKMKTENIADKNYEILSKMFPNALTETITGYDDDGKPIVERAIDADVLRQEISCKVVEGKDERYQFTWPDKKKAVLFANTPINKTLRPCREESVDFDNTENLYIEGDNLEVLKLLQETYLEQIKMIYIDPPYNTGNDFVYEDNFAIDTSAYMENSGQYDDNGNRLVKNIESNGRFHTDWLNMMYSRLKLARNLLTEDGAIFISIGDEELYNLEKIMDEIFGHKNYVTNMIWQSTPGSNTGEDVKTVTENILLYCKNKNECRFATLLIDDNEKYSNRDEYFEKRGGYILNKLDRRMTGTHYSEALNYSITTLDGSIVFPGGTENKQEHWNWRWSKSKVDWGIKNGFIVMKQNTEGWSIYFKQYEKVNNENIPIVRTVPYQNLINIEGANSAKGTREVMELFKGKYFDYPKPLSLMMHLQNMILKDNDILLDFFSGSATSAHAIILNNARNNENKKYILVQWPEEIDKESDAYKSGFKNICEIGKERIKRASKKISEEYPESVYDGGFRVLKCDSSNMKDIYYTPSETQQSLFDTYADNIKEDRTPEDLLFQVMLDLGVLLSSKIEETTIAGKQVFNVADGFLIACFDKDVTEETVKAVAEKKPYYAVFRDSSMANDSVATNFDQIFASISPETVRKVL
ncbi:site-specific DNA-methyltransferase [Eshraghiella crossota]|uniref:site-specific DNA-methyltransferase n=1 Tax=Eshraghiella crossota TaxID=45851 RepID=UPI003FF0DD7A